MNTLGLSPLNGPARPNARRLHAVKAEAGCVPSSLSTGGAARTARWRPPVELDPPMSLSPTMSAALLGLAGAPGPFPGRLKELCENTLDLVGLPEQLLRLRFGIDGAVCRAHRDTLLPVAHELVQNAVLHGMHLRLLGAIHVQVKAGPNGTLLDVADDGWGCGPHPVFGRGLRAVGILAESHGGSVSLERLGGWTHARVRLPEQRHA